MKVRNPTPPHGTPLPNRKILICHHLTCRKQGAAAVTAALRAVAPPDVEVVEIYCFGRCGNGPMVLMLPGGCWHHHVHPSDVPALLNAAS